MCIDQSCVGFIHFVGFTGVDQACGSSVHLTHTGVGQSCVCVISCVGITGVDQSCVGTI